NQNDLEAVNELVTYINNSKKQDIRDNILFTKMYVFCFTIFLEKYNCPNLAQNELHRIISKPTLSLYDEFFKLLNRIEFEGFCDLMGIKLESFIKSEEQRRIE